MSASDLNQVTLIGRMVRDPELRYAANEQSVTKFAIANNRVTGIKEEKKESVSFINCTAFGKTGEIIKEYCGKGKRIAIIGRIHQNTWQDKNGENRSALEVIVENFQFLTPMEQKSNTKGAASAVNDDFGF